MLGLLPIGRLIHQAPLDGLHDLALRCPELGGVDMGRGIQAANLLAESVNRGAVRADAPERLVYLFALVCQRQLQQPTQPPLRALLHLIGLVLQRRGMQGQRAQVRLDRRDREVADRGHAQQTGS